MAKLTTFTARIQTPNLSAPKYIPNCAIISGILVQIVEVGIGEPTIKGGFTPDGEGDTWEEYNNYETRYRPFFNAVKLKNDGKVDEVQKYSSSLNGAFTIEQLKTVTQYCFTMGDNGDGYMIEDYEEARKKMLIQKQIDTIEKVKQETGYQLEYLKPSKAEDEDGEITCYHYKITHIETGRVFNFSDRNVFDAGRCINPEYEIHPDWGIGGLIGYETKEVWIKTEPCKTSGYVSAKDDFGNYRYAKTKTHHKDYIINDNGEYLFEFSDFQRPVWQSCSKKNGEFVGWQKVRDIDKIEYGAYEIAQKYGKASNDIRL